MQRLAAGPPVRQATNVLGHSHQVLKVMYELKLGLRLREPLLLTIPALDLQIMEDLSSQAESTLKFDWQAQLVLPQVSAAQKVREDHHSLFHAHCTHDPPAAESTAW
jgi:hypothetical protein